LFSFSSIAQYHQSLIAGTVTCKQAVLFYLQQIEQQKKINAFVNIYAEEALEQAKVLDEERLNNPNQILPKLHGVVVSMKDVICYKNHPVTAASKMLAGFTSLYNATVVDKLLQADAIIIGSNNCDEFAMGSSSENSVYGATLNACDNNKVPGGSSGGSAVAVQANMSMVSLGSDTGGSVRQPADYCGIIGYKPTYGVISRHGLIAYASSFDQIGILSKTVEDVENVLAVISGPDAYDTTTIQEPVVFDQNENVQKFKIAYFKEALESAALDKEIANALEQKIINLQEEGNTVEAVNFPLMEYIVPTYYILTTAEASSNLNRYDGVKYGYHTKAPYKNLNEFYQLNRSEGFGKEVQKRIMLGTFVLSSGYYDAYFTKAQQVRQLLVKFMENVFATYDFVIMPTTPSTAPTIGDKEKDPIAVYMSDIYTVLANLTGIPAISIPLATHSNGMPFGIQILAAAKQDANLLQFAKSL
jgi:aspartyl-tRNA(Asn)/glutamyl-tRNA(Gln) amidotransferase subunit A